MSKIELKPCPFCGGEAELLIVPDRMTKWVVRCVKGCCCQFPHVSDHDAVEEWNRRADAPTVDAIPTEWIREQMCEYPGMESAMWSKLLRIWKREAKK